MDVLQTARPALHAGRQAVQYPNNVIIDAQAVFQILSHALRRKADQERVIGTLVGVRNEDGSEVEVKFAYIVPITETNEQVNVDVEYHKDMYQLVRKSYPESVILGWYATSSKLNNLSALIQDFYSREHSTFPWPPIHLTLETHSASQFNLQTYISTSIGVPPDQSSGNCIFLPVKNTVYYTSVDKSAMDLIRKVSFSDKNNEDVVNDIRTLDAMLRDVIAQIDINQKYVRDVIEGRVEGSASVGRQLFKSLTRFSSSHGGSVEKLLNGYLQDLFAVVCLTQAIKSQLEITSKLTTLV